MPFSILPFRPDLHASRSCFSSELMSPRMLFAFSAPEGYEALVLPHYERWRTTYAQFHRNGEIVYACFLCDFITPSNAGEVHVSRLNDTLLTLRGLDELFSESDYLISRSSLSQRLRSNTGSLRMPLKVLQILRRPLPGQLHHRRIVRLARWSVQLATAFTTIQHTLDQRC